jgi:hypothetical protein
MFIVVPGPAICMSGLFVTSRPECLAPVQLAVLAPVAMEPESPVISGIPDMSLMAEALD